MIYSFKIILLNAKEKKMNEWQPYVTRLTYLAMEG